MKSFLFVMLMVLGSTRVSADFDASSGVSPKTLTQAMNWMAATKSTTMSVTEGGKIWLLIGSTVVLCEYNPNGDTPCHAVK